MFDAAATLPISFTIGECYTRDEIHSVLGGSAKSFRYSSKKPLVDGGFVVTFEW
jgi:hypothetical protein